MPQHAAGIISEVMATGQVAIGPNIAKFEGLLRNYLGNPFIMATGDISNSLALCLFMAGVRPGDEVIMSPLVCLATSCPVRNLFADIRWCDVEPMTGNIDPADISKKITQKTKAIVVYHWAGNPAELDEIHAVARAHNIAVIEDAGEAFGAEYHGRKIGNTGSDYTVFSFYPNRHLTTIDGGAIACASQDGYEKAYWLKRYGIHQPTFRCEDGEINPDSDIPVAGWNLYMSHVAASIGIAQMDHIQDIVSRHYDNGCYYDEKLSDIRGITVLKRPVDSRSAFWVYTFLVQDRDHLLASLRNAGVQASKVHLRNDIYTCFGAKRNDLPGVDYFSAHSLSIPSGWWVDDQDRARIVDIILREKK
ncbi:MAG: aminotransferase class V-fold PLP-dependent enzyme [Nitrospirae bacterium]|nr:MAG: aminotransferase class V-fold PLP-dependent enzyme [Nitrospirota bacterium]